ncbi:hypothetical protein AB0D04_08470 [Streptomyces sp. NPDC048483]|uniref:hypothetical protein n=1 Tax=Streptomyces sp. NPDC048483 TaxID=3154927 RepID=UPI003414F842
MADEPYEWLDKDAAERLLRGDPVGAPDGDGARELQQLLDAAAAVGAGPAPSAELPGEAAAVAAFRRAQHGSGARPRRRIGAGRVSPVHTTRPGGVAERTRLARPFRRGFAVALAVCAISGVAVAAGTGVLPSPFQGGAPEPGASVSAAESPGTFASREPGIETDGATTRSPGASRGPGTTRPTEKPTGGGNPHGTKSPGTGGKNGNGKGDTGQTRPDKAGRKKLVLALCRGYVSGTLDADTRRRLERAAGGAEKVQSFCRKYLVGQGGSKGDNDGAVGSAPGDTQSGGGQGSDEDDDEHPSTSPSPTASPTSSSTPAPTPSAGTATPTAGTPSTAATGQV